MGAYDVVVLGGGPAGLATGVALSRLGRSVIVVEATRYERPRPGETFAGDLRPLLEALGAWDDFAALVPVPFRGVQSSWGDPSLAERASIYHPFGEGWHVDRARFDHLLARCAERAGVVVERGAKTFAIARRDASWHVQTTAGSEVTGRYLVDASGRGAPATAVHIPGRRWMRVDREVALIGRMTAPAIPIEPELLLEPVEAGWWYSVPQQDGALLVVLITDADLLPARGPTALTEHLSTRLACSVHTAARSAGATLSGPPWIARAESGLLVPDRGHAWRAVGDAAMACDPLAGDGVVRALRAAAEAAPEIARELDHPGATGATAQSMAERFRAYLDLRGRYYAREPRWPASPFWARRRPWDWQTAPLFLDPRRVLTWNGTWPERDRGAPVEALLPPHAVRVLLERLRSPAPAHEALAVLRAAAPPLEDRRLLVGLQMLIALDVVAVGP